MKYVGEEKSIVYDYWLYFRLCILQAPPPLLHGIHCFGMPWLIMQASHLQINKIANLSLHHGILCLHIVCCCSDRYMEAINQCQIQYCGLVVYTLYCKYNFEEDYFKFVYTKLFWYDAIIILILSISIFC